MGTVRDAIIGRTANVIKLITDNGRQYTRGRIAAINDIILIKNPKPAKKTEKRKRDQTQERKQAQEYEQAQASANTKPKTTKAVDAAANSPSVRRRYGDFSFLLGKTADKNITNFFGEVMIRAGETITLDVLRQAKISGKLIELCLHVK